MNPVENLGHQNGEMPIGTENRSELRIPDAEASTGARSERKLSAGVPVESRLESDADFELGSGDLVVVSANPKAGSGEGKDRVDALAKRLKRLGIEIIVESNTAELMRVVNEAKLAGRRFCVVAAGGDGTLNLVASVLPAGVPIMPFPLGTENLVSKHYGLISDSGVFDIEVAVATAVRGRLCHIDAGVATFFKRKKIRSEKMFLIMATVGFDADVVRRMHLTRKGHIRRWSYLKPILTSLRKYRYPRIRVEPLGSVDGVNEPKFEEPLTVAWALLFNLPRYAAGLSIETLADETDGSLDFCGLSRGSHANGIRYLLGVIFRKHTGWSDVKRMRGKHFRLSSVLPVAVQLDGDYAGRLPVEIRVEPLRVTLRLPPQKNPGNF